MRARIACGCQNSPLRGLMLDSNRDNLDIEVSDSKGRPPGHVAPPAGFDRARTLVEGQRLDQPTFHSLYEAMPPETRAELIDGVVYIPGPLSTEHGIAHVPVIVWLDYYAEKTPGVQVMDNATTILGWKSEPQPDGLLRICPNLEAARGTRAGTCTVPRSWSSKSPRRPGMSI